VAKFDRCPGNFDTSPDILKSLKVAGVHDSIILAMVRANWESHFFQSAAPVRGIMAEMNLARTMGVVVGFLAVLAYGHVISVWLAVLIFLLFAGSLVYLVFTWPNLRGGK
jgi:hypothetical protein